MPPHTVVPADAIETLVRLAKSAPPGAFAEIGVYKGGTAWHLAQVAREQSRTLHLFDTFTGIPEAGPHDQQHKIGDFDAGGADAVRAAIPDAVFHVGVFPATMPPDLESLAFVHVDCDQYASICACIDRLMPLLVPGGMMLFDDYGHTSGARKAVEERLAGRFTVTGQGKALVVKDGG